MNEQFKVVFVGMADGKDQQSAAIAMADRLKTSPSKIQQFYAGKNLFAPADKAKALKQVKLLASAGINAKLQSQTAATPTNADQERVFEALDYITSSLIRIEERLEELEQRVAPTAHTEIEDTTDEEWETKELFDELDFEPSPPAKSKTWLYYLLAVLIILFILLGVSLFFPEWLALE
ncbi:MULTISPECIES: hypothetical protein [Pseudoalteromonas]|uniref:hypothetical protein n=1 Tax=Pseudoalteromonas TaxID=53246 RepID=UPI00029A88CE|nr:MULTISPECIES: hypothetical protein [Pseudoalteromonas]AUJ70996.1 hypothetical protein PNC201_13680 [Pseudoalteromonas sp. NC201]MBR8843927.1 hypothetical protein [Pseudoalteromonas sp. JC3]MCF2825130.1 hypothetical protein [Pseudoalteromonas sp. OF5H-5]MCF2832247.1 hypothetical protein [Pseudoalteromonas sp. DL2-H6]MCF2925630.1 hypothetical protein [Pseudoalteromonas sp. DL2-H1]